MVSGTMFSFRPQIPKFTGPYTVGSAEYEIPLSEIDTQTSPPDPTISTLKFRLFYPTSAPYKGQTIPWVPSPQRQWTEAFGRFLGASLGWSSIVNPLLSLMTYITIPAIPNAPLRTSKRPYPLVIFSHGLAGNCNTYSSLCGSLASCGVVVAAVEHRDGSCPISMIRNAKGQVSTQIGYRKYSHNPTPDVFNARNAQLRTRLWELDLLYTALNKLNAGDRLSNYATAGIQIASPPALKSSMDFAPGRITWAGHSFGACTMTQFVKSIYYHRALPHLEGTSHENDVDWRPLFTLRSDSDLINQITPLSPVALLDVWTMPFRAPSTRWLWEKPMPCHELTQSSTMSSAPTTISVMSTEFYNWTDLLNRTRALLSANPTKATEEISLQSEPRSPKTPKLEDTTTPKTPTFATPPNKHFDDDDEAAQHETDLLPPPSLPLDSKYYTAEPVDRSMTSSPASSTFDAPADSPASSTTSISPSLTAKPILPSSVAHSEQNTVPIAHPSTPPTRPRAALYHIPHSAHLSQSDFGPLFPTLTRMLMKAVDAHGTMQLNIRAVTQTMRNAGVRGVERVDWATLPSYRHPDQKQTNSRSRSRSRSSRSKNGWFVGWFGGRSKSGSVGAVLDNELQGNDDDVDTTTEDQRGEKQQRQQQQQQQEETDEKEKLLLHDDILQDTRLQRWRELDVPLVST